MRFFLQPKNKVFVKMVFVIVLCSFFGTSIGGTYAYAATALPYMPAADARIGISQKYMPATLAGIKLYADDPLKFDFIIHKGNGGLSDAQLKEEAAKLVKYFLASLTIPENDLWVNLSPFEKNKIVETSLSQTELGQDLLGQDYVLKQLTASVTYPESPLGKKFWDTVYERAQKQFGTTQLPLNTYNKIWIVPAKAHIYEGADKAVIGEARLKVMMEADYVAAAQHNNAVAGLTSSGLTHQPVGSSTHQPDNALTTAVMKEIVVPMIQEDVNSGKNFSHLRQMYSALLLGMWFKRKLRESIETVSSVEPVNQLNTAQPAKPSNWLNLYIDKQKIKGVQSQDPAIKEKIYNQYLEAYKKGVYDYMKKEFDTVSKKQVRRRYFSGGLQIAPNENQLIREPLHSLPVVGILPEGDGTMIITTRFVMFDKSGKRIGQALPETVTKTPSAQAARISSPQAVEIADALGKAVERGISKIYPFGRVLVNMQPSAIMDVPAYTKEASTEIGTYKVTNPNGSIVNQGTLSYSSQDQAWSAWDTTGKKAQGSFDIFNFMGSSGVVIDDTQRENLKALNQELQVLRASKETYSHEGGYQFNVLDNNSKTLEFRFVTMHKKDDMSTSYVLLHILSAARERRKSVMKLVFDSGITENIKIKYGITFPEGTTVESGAQIIEQYLAAAGSPIQMPQRNNLNILRNSAPRLLAHGFQYDYEHIEQGRHITVSETQSNYSFMPQAGMNQEDTGIVLLRILSIAASDNLLQARKTITVSPQIQRDIKNRYGIDLADNESIAVSAQKIRYAFAKADKLLPIKMLEKGGFVTFRGRDGAGLPVGATVLVRDKQGKQIKRFIVDTSKRVQWFYHEREGTFADKSQQYYWEVPGESYDAAAEHTQSIVTRIETSLNSVRQYLKKMQIQDVVTIYTSNAIVIKIDKKKNHIKNPRMLALRLSHESNDFVRVSARSRKGSQYITAAIKRRFDFAAASPIVDFKQLKDMIQSAVASDGGPYAHHRFHDWVVEVVSAIRQTNLYQQPDNTGLRKAIALFTGEFARREAFSNTWLQDIQNFVEQAIRTRAYQIWQAKGSPQNQDENTKFADWRAAEQELLSPYAVVNTEGTLADNQETLEAIAGQYSNYRAIQTSQTLKQAIWQGLLIYNSDFVRSQLVSARLAFEGLNRNVAGITIDDFTISMRAAFQQRRTGEELIELLQILQNAWNNKLPGFTKENYISLLLTYTQYALAGKQESKKFLESVELIELADADSANPARSAQWVDLINHLMTIKKPALAGMLAVLGVSENVLTIPENYVEAAYDSAIYGFRPGASPNSSLEPAVDLVVFAYDKGVNFLNAGKRDALIKLCNEAGRQDWARTIGAATADSAKEKSASKIFSKKSRVNLAGSPMVTEISGEQIDTIISCIKRYQEINQKKQSILLKAPALISASNTLRRALNSLGISKSFDLKALEQEGRDAADMLYSSLSKAKISLDDTTKKQLSFEIAQRIYNQEFSDRHIEILPVDLAEYVEKAPHGVMLADDISYVIKTINENPRHSSIEVIGAENRVAYVMRQPDTIPSRQPSTIGELEKRIQYVQDTLNYYSGKNTNYGLLSFARLLIQLKQSYFYAHLERDSRAQEIFDVVKGTSEKGGGLFHMNWPRGAFFNSATAITYLHDIKAAIQKSIELKAYYISQSMPQRTDEENWITAEEIVLGDAFSFAGFQEKALRLSYEIKHSALPPYAEAIAFLQGLIKTKLYASDTAGYFVDKVVYAIQHAKAELRNDVAQAMKDIVQRARAASIGKEFSEILTPAVTLDALQGRIHKGITASFSRYGKASYGPIRVVLEGFEKTQVMRHDSNHFLKTHIENIKRYIPQDIPAERRQKLIAGEFNKLLERARDVIDVYAWKKKITFMDAQAELLRESSSSSVEAGLTSDEKKKASDMLVQVIKAYQGDVDRLNVEEAVNDILYATSYGYWQAKEALLKALASAGKARINSDPILDKVLGEFFTSIVSNQISLQRWAGRLVAVMYPAWDYEAYPEGPNVFGQNLALEIIKDLTTSGRIQPEKMNSFKMRPDEHRFGFLTSRKPGKTFQDFEVVLDRFRDVLRRANAASPVNFSNIDVRGNSGVTADAEGAFGGIDLKANAVHLEITKQQPNALNKPNNPFSSSPIFNFNPENFGGFGVMILGTRDINDIRQAMGISATEEISKPQKGIHAEAEKS